MDYNFLFSQMFSKMLWNIKKLGLLWVCMKPIIRLLIQGMIVIRINSLHKLMDIKLKTIIDKQNLQESSVSIIKIQIIFILNCLKNRRIKIWKKRIKNLERKRIKIHLNISINSKNLIFCYCVKRNYRQHQLNN